ncbi:MAG: hypothetical protein H8D94_00930 [Candidatus Pelagibacter sp.]|nr:hypothetical protein [Candidatus Pelagibacter sp.]
MATKQEVKSQFIQALIDTIVTNGNINLDSYRRHVGDDGQFTTAPLEDSNQQIVLYNEGYQVHHTFNDTVESIADCFESNLPDSDGSYPIGGYENFISDGLTYQADNIYYSCWETGVEVGNYTTNDECIDTGCALCNFQYYGEQGNPVVLFNFETVTCGINYITITDEVLPILSQLVGFNTSYTEINPTKAKEVLDTEIFELIPKSKTRQQEIDNFFASYHRLKGELPAWDDDFDNDGTPDHFLDPVDETNYTTNHDITTNPDGSIVRLSSDSTEVNPTEKTLEGLRLDLDTFLRDIDTPLETQGEDERPTYEHKSPGHIKIRHLNQAIIVRNKEGNDIGIMGNPNPNPKFLTDGFTITMWVKFLDKVSGGTLFNFGNPLRENNPFGFTLETFVVNKEDYGDIPNFEDSGFFSNGDQERFVRLVVNDTDNVIRDSHVGSSINGRIETANYPALEYNRDYAFNYTHIPVDLNEWYFIVANFNTGVDEDASHDDGADTNSDYWKWNWNGSSYTHFSGLGAKCKVEIISKSDLIRARGFKLEKS